jgi:hypothetical protein
VTPAERQFVELLARIAYRRLRARQAVPPPKPPEKRQPKGA